MYKSAEMLTVRPSQVRSRVEPKFGYVYWREQITWRNRTIVMGVEIGGNFEGSNAWDPLSHVFGPILKGILSVYHQ
jgi:hypothetical protein